MNGQPYHSALHPALASESILFHRFKTGSVAMVHNLLNPLPKEFDACDVLYADPPWPAGIERFDQRAGVVTAGGFDGIMAALTRIIGENTHRPVVLVIGKAALRRLPAPRMIRRTQLVGRPAILVSYHQYLDQLDGMNGEPVKYALGFLATKYQCIGDMTCGYGEASMAFHAAGKRFVASDYNARCIGKLVSLID